MADYQLSLRRVRHPMAKDNYRVVWNDGVKDRKIGSLGVQTGAAGRTFWSWGIETVVAVLDFPTHGEAADREAAMAAFREAWDKFASDPARLALFLRFLRD